MAKFRKIKGYSSYAISKKGTIIRLIDDKNTWKGRILRGHIGWHGYKMVTLNEDRIIVLDKRWGYNSSTHYIHRLVAKTYIDKNISLENIRENEHINHKDNNKLNNCVNNLEIVTRSENIQHAYLTKGLNVPFGPFAKLTVIEVRKIKKSLKKGAKIIDIARKYRVQWNTINRIKRNYTWKFV